MRMFAPMSSSPFFSSTIRPWTSPVWAFAAVARTISNSIGMKVFRNVISSCPGLQVDEVWGPVTRPCRRGA